MQLVAGVLHDVDQVAVVVRRVGAVDAHDDGLGAEIARQERGDHLAAGGLLLPRRDGVLEVEEDLVGIELRSLGEEALAGAGHGVARAARAGHGHAPTLPAARADARYSAGSTSS